MFNNIRISDIANNTHNINNKSKYILIHLENNYSLLSLLTERKSDHSKIYGYNQYIIKNILKKKNIDINNFRFLYHIFVKKKYPKFIVIGNKSITKLPWDYQKTFPYNNGYVWRPISNNGYFGLGLLYGIEKATINDQEFEYGIVDVNYLIRIPWIAPLSNTLLYSSYTRYRSLNLEKLYNSEIDPNRNKDKGALIASINEFNSLTTPDDPQFTINRGIVYDGRNKFKLINENDKKYITNEFGVIKMEPEKSDVTQYITYNSKNQLTIHGYCLTAKSEDVNNDGLNNDVILEYCKPSNDIANQQKWYPYYHNGKIIFYSIFNNKCMTSHNGIVITEDFNSNNKNQLWIKKESIYDDEHNYFWQEFKGKSVILVSSDNPWYKVYYGLSDVHNNEKVNEENIDDKHYHEPEIHKEIYPDIKGIDVNTPEYGKFKNEFQMDPCRYDLGYGYSYASRRGIPCIDKLKKQCELGEKIVEGFDNNNNFIKDNIIIISILIIFIIVIIIRKKY